MIVGAGAAGLATAIFCAQASSETPARPRVVLLDGAARIGAKILVAGGGRCNVTHERIVPEDFQGPRPVIRNVLREFDEQRTIAWFAAMGVELKREATGKLFPVTDDAHTVLQALLQRCRDLGVAVRTNHRVLEVRRTEHGFEIDHQSGALRSQYLVMATGGRSLPKTGSDGAGWSIVQRLGHTVTPTYPALVPLVLDESFFYANLSGVSHDVELTTLADGKRIDRRTGSLLWTHFGVSGPVVMDASRFWVIAHAQGRRPELRCGFLPGEMFESVDRMLVDAAAASATRTLSSVLTRSVPRRVAEALCVFSGIESSCPLGQLPREKRRRLVHALTGLPLPVVRDRGWNYAEVTAGGVPLAEIDHRTMQSRCVPGLHLVGEILDCDGRIGGFNFQWAWSTGYIAGKALGNLSP